MHDIEIDSLIKIGLLEASTIAFYLLINIRSRIMYYIQQFNIPLSTKITKLLPLVLCLFVDLLNKMFQLSSGRSFRPFWTSE